MLNTLSNIFSTKHIKLLIITLCPILWYKLYIFLSFGEIYKKIKLI